MSHCSVPECDTPALAGVYNISRDFSEKSATLANEKFYRTVVLVVGIQRIEYVFMSSSRKFHLRLGCRP